MVLTRLLLFTSFNHTVLVTVGWVRIAFITDPQLLFVIIPSSDHRALFERGGSVEPTVLGFEATGH